MPSAYQSCTLCPRQCHANRADGQTGYCGETDQCRIGAILPHFGEEPCISGRRGSGTFFFSGCSCGCFFCQNHQISHEHIGRIVTDEELYQSAVSLIRQGVHNLNFVTPDHWWPHLQRLCKRLRDNGYDIPFLWNSSGYSLAAAVREQCRLIDIFLPDFKFADPELAQRCMGDAHYPEIALDALKAAVDALGFLRPFDPDGDITATRGVMVRHLVLPGQKDNSLKVLDLLADHFGPSLPISVMNQFIPVPACHERHFLDSRLAQEDYAAVCRHIVELGFIHAFIQPESGDDAFMPDFTRDRPFEGNPLK